MPDRSSRTALLWDVCKRIDRIVNYKHVNSIIEILFEEMLKDLIAGKKIQILNFGTFDTNLIKPHRYYNFYFREMRLAASYRKIKLTLTHKLQKKLCRLWDLDNPPPSDENE